MRLQQLYKYNWISSATFNSLIRLEVCGIGVMIMVILPLGGGEGSGLLYDDLDDTYLANGPFQRRGPLVLSVLICRNRAVGR